MTLHYPLNWPARQARAKVRRPSQFAARTVTSAVRELGNELARLGATEVHLSTGIPVTASGYFHAQYRPRDGEPGAALYFTRKGIEHAMASDVYLVVEDNVWALVKTIEAMRAIERHGSADLADQAFTGFAALPAPQAVECWWDILDVSRNAPESSVRAVYRDRARMQHPDQPGGSHEAMQRLNGAMEQFEAELEERKVAR